METQAGKLCGGPRRRRSGARGPRRPTPSRLSRRERDVGPLLLCTGYAALIMRACRTASSFRCSPRSRSRRSHSRHRAPRRPLTIEDYYRIQTVGSPTLSDDGRTVTFTVSTRVESGQLDEDGNVDGCRLTAPANRGAWRLRPNGPGEAPAAVESVKRHEPRWRMDRADHRQAAAEGGADLRERLREAAPGALQRGDLRLEGLPARWAAVPRAESTRASGAADCRHAGDRRGLRGCCRMPMCARRTLCGSRTAPNCSSSPIRTGATSSNTRALTCGRSRTDGNGDAAHRRRRTCTAMPRTRPTASTSRTCATPAPT